MQYKEGKIPNKNVNNIWNKNECLRSTVGNIATIAPASKADVNKSQKKDKPDFCILRPWLVVNSNFSLSKVRLELCLANITELINANQNRMLPKGCGTINPEANPINKKKANIKFQKLSLLSLAAIKPVFSVLESCIVKALDCFSDSVNVVKSAMISYYNDWYKTYDLIIAKFYQNLKQIIQNIRVFALRLVEIGRLATLIN